MITKFAACLVGLIFLAASPPGQATLIHFNVTLDGAQAGTVSPGTGSATLDLDTVANTLVVNLSYSGLLAPTTNAHIHCCAPPGVSAGVIIPFVPPFVTGLTSGTFLNTFNLTATQVTQVASGLSYINIHTTLYPAGEIRGQIVPEPASLALVFAGLVVAALMRRPRRV
jgi:hypothetical protein